VTTEPGRSAVRVVSLLPAGTEIVAALGALESLVGVTHECDFPAEVSRLPRVTASAVDRDASSPAIDAAVRALSSSGAPVFTLDAGDLRRLAPTLILTQSLCEVCAVSEGDVRAIAEVLSPPPHVLPLVGTTLDGVWEDVIAVGAALGRSAAAANLLAAIAQRLRRVHETLRTARAPRPRVAVVEWLDPLFAAGHWTPELVRRAGGIDVLATAGAHSVTVTMDQLRAADPEVLLFAPCGFDVERTAREAGNALTSRPGPRLADAVEVMAAIFSPGLFAAPAPSYARQLA